MQSAVIRTEAVAGVTTFFTMAYIIFVNPSILATEGTGMSFTGVMTATVVVASLMTLLMGLYAKIPFAVAPGMGLNLYALAGRRRELSPTMLALAAVSIGLLVLEYAG